MMDQIEQWEAAAERWAADNVVGDQFVCGCGQQCFSSEGVYVSPNPFAPPMCPECAGQING